MMKILFIQRIEYEYLGTELLSAILEESGHSTSLVFDHGARGLKNKVQSASPDLIAFSCTTGLHNWTLRTATGIKRFTDTPIVLGGPHATFSPDTIHHDSIDMLCRGEGEKSFVMLADSLQQGKDIKGTPNFVFKENGEIIENDLLPLEQDIDSFPFLNREIYYRDYPFFKSNPARAFMGGRSTCDYQCGYCHNPAMLNIYKDGGKYRRLFSVDRLMDEIIFVRDKYGLKMIEFIDDAFGYDREWLTEFCDKFIPLKGAPTFTCKASADYLTEETVSLLKDARCNDVRIGVETAIEENRTKILSKPITNDQIIKAVGLLKKYKIRFGTFNVMGYPGETVEECVQTILFNAKLKPDFPWASLFQPYPMLPLTKMAEQMGILPENHLEKIHMSFFHETVLQDPETQKIANLQKFFVLLVKYPRLLPAVRFLIRFPRNPFFTTILHIGWIMRYVGSNRMSLGRVFRTGLNVLRAIRN